jgi:hypothetical protein
METHIQSWVFHPEDESVDVAVTRISLPPDADHMAFPIQGIADQDFIAKNDIGIGDEVFFPGLFAPHKGETKNIPIVRIGTIAAMAEEPVSCMLPDKKAIAMDAFLVECRSIGGLSGSPVFVTPGLVRFMEGKIRATSNPHRAFRVLGLMHGHFKLDPLSRIIGDDPITRERLNMGIAVVQSGNKILEVLNQPFIQRKEAEVLERMRSSDAPETDEMFGEND